MLRKLKTNFVIGSLAEKNGKEIAPADRRKQRRSRNKQKRREVDLAGRRFQIIGIRNRSMDFGRRNRTRLHTGTREWPGTAEQKSRKELKSAFRTKKRRF